MKVTLLTDDFPPQSYGGAGISTYDIAMGLSKAGHDVSVITTCRNADEAGEFDFDGLKVFRIANTYHGKWRWYRSLYNPPVVGQVKTILEKIQPDVVHVNNIHFYISYHSIAVAKKVAKVVVWTGRDVMAFNFSKLQTKHYLDHFNYKTTWLDHVSQAKRRWNPFRNMVIRKYLRYPDKLFAVSNALVDALAANRIKGVTAMHTGIDASLWIPEEGEVCRLKAKYELENKRVILFGGRLSGAKGGNETLEAVARVVSKFPEAVLLIVSKIDGHTEQMKIKAQKLGIEKNLVLTGWVDRRNIKNVYGCADIVLVPSVCFDSLPRIVLEAMAVGKPVVGTCYGGAREAIEDGITGYVVNPLHTEEVAMKLIELLTNLEKLRQFGTMGIARIQSNFNLKTTTKNLISEYEMLLNRNDHRK